MRIGIAQINTTPGAFDQTVERMIAQSQRAVEQGVDLLIFPLAALAGIDVVPYADRLSFMVDEAEAVALLSGQLACPAILPVPMDLDAQEGHYDALLIDAGEVKPLRMLSHATTNGMQPQTGEAPAQFDVGGVRFGLALSYADLDAFDDAARHVDAIVFLSGYPFALDDPSSAMGADIESARYVEDARASGSWLIGAASVGGYGDQVFSGSSMVVAPSGELVALAPAFEEALLVADIAIPPEDTAVNPVVPEVFDAPFALWQAIVLGIHDYVVKQGMSDVALCLDGTLGSCVLAALATDAVGPLHVHVVVGASAGSRAPSCRDLARRLRVDVLNATGQLPGYDARDADELELATLARLHDALALSSCDKTALALGERASWLNAAALCPLGDVYRSDVLDMAHVRNTISPLFRRVDLTEADAVRLTMLDGTVRQLTSEADITDLDEVLLSYIEYERPLAELVGDDGIDDELVDAALRMVRTSEQLRRSAAPVLVMSTHTLEDTCFPLAMQWHDEHIDKAFDAAAPYEPENDPRPMSEAMPFVERTAHHTNMDVDGTLAMLRDLMEQGGLPPYDLASFGGNAAQGEQAPGAHGLLGWMNSFSEN